MLFKKTQCSCWWLDQQIGLYLPGEHSDPAKRFTAKTTENWRLSSGPSRNPRQLKPDLEGLLLLFIFFLFLAAVGALGADTGFGTLPLPGWAAFLPWAGAWDLGCQDTRTHGSLPRDVRAPSPEAWGSQVTKGSHHAGLASSWPPEMTRYSAFDFGSGALALEVEAVCVGFLLLVRTALAWGKQNEGRVLVFRTVQEASEQSESTFRISVLLFVVRKGIGRGGQ